MEERINQALAQIEKDLQNIKSAKEQVDSVVASSSQLKEKVGAFVSDVANLSKQVEQLMHSIADKSKDNLSNFKESMEALNRSCAEIITSFENKTNAAANAVTSEIDKLHGEIEKLDAARNILVSATDAIKKLNDNVEKLTSEIKVTQSAQDDELRAIKGQMTELSSRLSDLDTKSGNIIESLQTHYDSLVQLSQSLNAANTALSGISPLIQTAQSSLSNQIQNDTNQVAQKLVASLGETKLSLEKRVSRLQIIVIVQLILSVAGIVLMFVVK